MGIPARYHGHDLAHTGGMAILLVVLLLFGFVGFGVGSSSTSTGDVLKVPPQKAQLHPDRCSSSKRGHKMPRPLRNCALRSSARP